MNIIQKIIKKFNSLRQDKKDHVLLGIIIGFPLILFFGLWGGIMGIILVLAKEIVHDGWLKKGNPDKWDFIASAIPILMFLVMRYLYYFYS